MESKELVDLTPIEQTVDRLNANAVFGEPTTEHGVVVIPVAQVAFGFGYGGGYGEGQPSDEGVAVADAGEEEGDASRAEMQGGGGGGGAGGRVTPRGYIRISEEGVTYESIEDEKVIPLAGILMVAWSVFWIATTVRYIAKQAAKTRQARIATGQV